MSKNINKQAIELLKMISEGNVDAAVNQRIKHLNSEGQDFAIKFAREVGTLGGIKITDSMNDKVVLHNIKDTHISVIAEGVYNSLVDTVKGIVGSMMAEIAARGTQAVELSVLQSFVEVALEENILELALVPDEIERFKMGYGIMLKTAQTALSYEPITLTPIDPSSKMYPYFSELPVPELMATLEANGYIEDMMEIVL